MNHAEVIHGLQDLIRDIDREMDKLQATLREGERLRAQLLRQAMALAWEERDETDEPSVTPGNRSPARIVRNDP
jgi:hypothetical protein